MERTENKFFMISFLLTITEIKKDYEMFIFYNQVQILHKMQQHTTNFILFL